MGSSYFLEKHTPTYKQKQIFYKKICIEYPGGFTFVRGKGKKKEEKEGEINSLPDNVMSEQVSHWKLTTCTFKDISDAADINRRTWME